MEEEVRSVLKEYPDDVLKLTHGRKVSIVSYQLASVDVYMDLGIIYYGV